MEEKNVWLWRNLAFNSIEEIQSVLNEQCEWQPYKQSQYKLLFESQEYAGMREYQRVYRNESNGQIVNLRFKKITIAKTEFQSFFKRVK